MRVNRLFAAAVVSVVGTVGTVAVSHGAVRAAAGEWGPTVNLTAPQRVGVPAVAIGHDGTAIVTWGRRSDAGTAVYASVRRPDGAWEHATRVPGTRGAGEHRIGVAGDGEKVLVWTAGRTVKAARCSPAGNWSTPDVLYRTSNAWMFPVNLRLGVNHRGRAVVAWNTMWADVPEAGTATSVSAVVGHSRGGWTAVRRVSTAHSNAGDPEVGIDDAGDVTVSWVQWNDSSHRVMTASRATGERWDVSRTVTWNSAGDSELAVAPSGQVAVAWVDETRRPDRIQVRRWSEATGWGDPDTMPEVAGGVASLDIGMDAAGTVTFAWSTHAAGVRSGTQSVDREWSRAVIAPRGSVFYRVVLVVNPAGDAVVGWESVDGGEHPVQAAHRAFDGMWSSVSSLSTIPGDAFGPALALDSDGDAVAAWAYLRDIMKSDTGRVQARSLSMR